MRSVHGIHLVTGLLVATVGWLGRESASAQNPTFELQLEPRPPAFGPVGGAAEFAVRCRLATRGLQPGAEGARGWSFGVVAGAPCSIREATTLNTVAADVSRGGLRQLGFERTELTVGAGNEGVVTAVALSTSLDISLDPAGSPHDVLSLGVVGETPKAGDCQPCLLRFVSGLVGSGEPVSAVVTYQRQSFDPALGRLSVDVCPVDCFPEQPTPGWQRFDVGDVVGAVRPVRPDGYELCSATAGYSADRDNLLFLARPALREFELNARLNQLGPTGHGGIDAHADFGTFPDPTAPYVAIWVERLATGGLVLRSSYREDFGGKADLQAADPVAVQLPVHLRIVQKATELVTLYSQDGTTFREHLSIRGTSALYVTGSYRVGMAQASRARTSSNSIFSGPTLEVQQGIRPPVVDSVEPRLAPFDVATEVVIRGSGLGGTSEVTVAGARARILSAADGSVRVLAGPVASPVRGDVVIRTPEGSQAVSDFLFVGKGFIRCDCNGDGKLDISDAIAYLSFLFLGGPPCECPDAGDCNSDGRGDISDPIAALAFLFLGGPEPAPPYPDPGIGTTPSLACGLVPTPTILRISQQRIQEGDLVTIDGEGFSSKPDENIVLFGDSQAEVVESSARRLLVRVGPLLRAEAVDVTVIPSGLIDIITALGCKAKACSPILVIPTDIIAILRDPPFRVDAIPSNLVSVASSTPNEEGGLDVKVDPDILKSGESVSLQFGLLLPAVQGLARGSFVGMVEHSLPVGNGGFDQTLLSLSDRIRRELSGGGTPFEFDVVPRLEDGVIAINPRKELLDFLGGGLIGGIGGYIPGPGRPPGGKCGPDDLDPIADERAFGWCRLEEQVELCNGLPRFEYFIPDELVFQESDDIFPRPDPNTLSPAQKSVMYNQDAYCHVRRNQLWNICRVADLAADGDDQVPHFPRSAIVMKSSWRTAAQMPGAANLANYYSYTHTGTGTTYYLVALHFTTKDIDDWVWIDIYIPVAGSTSFGGCGGTNADVPASLAGTVWANYHLCTNVTNSQSLANHCGNFAFCPECPDTLDGGCGADTCLNCHEGASVFTSEGSIDSDFLFSLNPITPAGGCP